MSRSRAGPATPAETPRGRSAIQIVVTPGSGAGRALRTARRLATLLRRRGRESSLRTFGNLAALRRWAETCEPDFSHLVCVGGDATMSAAAHAAIRLDLPFVAVPQGFGNVFARTFHYPNRPEAVASLLGARPRAPGRRRSRPERSGHRGLPFAPQLRLARADPKRRRARASAAAQSRAALPVVLRASRTSSCSGGGWRPSTSKWMGIWSPTTPCWSPSPMSRPIGASCRSRPRRRRSTGNLTSPWCRVCRRPPSSSDCCGCCSGCRAAGDASPSTAVVGLW